MYDLMINPLANAIFVLVVFFSAISYFGIV